MSTDHAPDGTRATGARKADTPRRTDLVRRAVLPVAAVLALLADAPPAVAGGVALAGLAASLERLARLRHRGLVDATAAWAGSLVVALVLTGVALGSTGAGLTARGWTLALSGVAAAGLVVAAVLPRRVGGPPYAALEQPPGGDLRRAVLALLPWVALAVGAVVLAVRLSAGSVTEVDPLAASIGRVDGTRVEVVLTSGEATGPLEVRTTVEGGETSYPLVSVAAGGRATAVVSLPTSGRATITLTRPGETEVLRTLVLDR